MKNIKVKQRIRKDLILLSISMFAIVGSIFVFQSYAQQRVNTKIPGVIPISSLESNVRSSFIEVSLNTRKGLTYCVPAMLNSSTETPYIKESNSITIKLLLINDRYCYTSLQDDKAIVYLSSVYDDQNLTISY